MGIEEEEKINNSNTGIRERKERAWMKKKDWMRERERERRRGGEKKDSTAILIM